MDDHRPDNDLLTLPDGCRLTRRDFLALGLGAGAAVALASCVPPTPGATPGPEKAPPEKAAAPARKLATSVKFGAPSIASTLDPHSTLSWVNYQAIRPTYDALVTFDRKGEKIVGELASEWKRVDALTYEFKLRDNVKFSNGEAFTAQTVKANLERVLNSKSPDHSDIKGRLGAIASAEVVNSTTVRIKTKEPDPLVLNRLTLLFMLPSKLAADTETAKSEALGTGPLKTVRFTVNKEIAFEAWDGSYRGKSTVQTASIQAIPEPATLLAALRTGEVDILFSPPADQVAGLERDGFKVLRAPAGTATIISFIPNHPLMKDKRVREALNYAVDKEELLKTVQAGFGRVITGQLIEPGMLGYQEDLKPIPYDPERAKSLLREANATDQELLLMTNPDHRRVVEAVVGYMNAAGFKARGDYVERAIMTQGLTRGTDRPMIGWSANYFHIRDFDAAGFRFSTLVPQPHFDNAEYHRLYLAARSEVDEKKRVEMIARMIRLMRDEFAVLFLLWRDNPTLHSKKVLKLDVAYDNSYPIWEIEKEA